MNLKFLLIPILAFSAYSLIQLNPTPTKKRLHKTEKELKYDQPDKAAAWLSSMRQSQEKNKSAAQLNKQIKTTVDSIELTRKLNKAASTTNIPKLAFENLGPSNFAGRIRGFVIKPDDSYQLLAGSVSGGVFKSNNQGQSWEVLDDFLPSLAIGSMTSDPDEPNRVFLGTGEGYFNFDAARGAGIFVSENFGNTWNQLAATDNENFYFVNRLARIPDSDILVAATRKGIFRSLDLGNNWTETSQFTVVGRGFVDLKVDPSNPNHLLSVHYGNSNNALSLDISSPASANGSYEAVLASFGPEFPASGTGNKSIVLINDGTGTTNDACETINANLSGKIALAQRGSCNFTVKVKNAQNAGAVAVVIYQNTNDSPFEMGGEDETITIPSAMISKADGEFLANQSGLNGGIKNVIKTVLSRFVMESNDAGASWNQLSSSDGLPVSNVGRMELAFGTDGVTYVMVSNDDDKTLGLWKSTGNGTNFIKTTSNTQFIERQGWYDLAIAVDPHNSNKLFVGAIDQYVSTDGGNTLTKNTKWDPVGENNDISKYMHSDHHGYIFDPNNSNIVYTVGDGGVYKSTNNGVSYKVINSGLSISQSYGIDVHPNNGRVASGTQDNGSHIYFGDNNTWLEWWGGDGGYIAWDKQNTRFLYGSNPEGGMFGSNNSGNSVEFFELPDTDGALFIQPFALDPSDGNRMIVGTDNVFFTTNARLISNAQFTDISGALASGSVSALTFNPITTSEVIVGMTSGNVYKIQNIGTQNTVIDITPASNLFGSITDIKIDTNDSSGKTLYITRSNYGEDRILKSVNGGTSWISLSGDLPDMPLYQVSIDPLDPNRIFVGSELGLWVTNVGSGTPQWTRYHYGVAYTRVVDLVWSGVNTLYIGTHGRGTYKASRNALELKINKVVTTDSSNDDDGILDAGETGLILFEIKNNSGFAVSGADLSLTINQNTLINLPTIAPHSSIVVSHEITLDPATSCMNILGVEASLQYDTINTIHNFELLTAADKNTNSTEFTEGAENSEHSMTVMTGLGNSPWKRVTNESNSGNSSWFTTNEGAYSDKSLVSPWLIMNSGGNTLSFALKYKTEGDSTQYWDGAVLEIREKGGLWQDIGHLSSVSYDGQLFTNNTASTRRAWSGDHNTWRNAMVDLSSNYQGKTIQFRFRMISDSSVAEIGFWVDDMKMTHVIWDDKEVCDENINQGHKLPLTGFWYDRSRNGHGFVIEPIGRENRYFTVFYTYDDNGKPEWYTSLSTLENGILNINFEPDTLLRTIYDFTIDPAAAQAFSVDPTITDGRLSIDFNSDSVFTSNACQDGVTGRPQDLIALATWKINSQQGQWCIEPIIGETNKGFPDVAGNWYGGVDDSGWGISFAIAQKVLVATLYYYDQTGQPRWAIGQQDDFEVGKPISIQMNEVSGFGRLNTAIQTTSVPAGTITATINNHLGNIAIDGKSTVNVEYQGTEGGQWIRNNVPITILTKPHD